MNQHEKWLDQICDPAHAGLPSIAIVAAHPDDETISAAAAISRWLNVSRSTGHDPRFRIIHVTDGSPRELSDASRAGFQTRRAYARARRSELLAAMNLVGVPEQQLIQLDHVDQEVSFSMAPFARELAGLLEQHAPQIVITHPYEGGHPDHDAAAFAVSIACRRLWQGQTPPPLIIEMASYHNRGGGMENYCFLGDADFPERTLTLTPDERQLKRRMIECFPTQRPVLEQFPVEIERFRIAPDYDFCAPPHEGILYYELLNWEMSGTHWRALARAALDQLGVSSIR